MTAMKEMKIKTKLSTPSIEYMLNHQIGRCSQCNTIINPEHIDVHENGASCIGYCKSCRSFIFISITRIGGK